MGWLGKSLGKSLSDHLEVDASLAELLPLDRWEAREWEPLPPDEVSVTVRARGWGGVE